ncbi:putative Ig domain-containing protein [Fibrobacterota bacterium]
MKLLLYILLWLPVLVYSIPGYTDFTYSRFTVHVDTTFINDNGYAYMQSFLDKFEARYNYLEQLTSWSHDKLFGSQMEIYMETTPACYGGLTQEMGTYRRVSVNLHSPMEDPGCAAFYRDGGESKFGNPGEMGDHWNNMAVMLHESTHGIIPNSIAYNNWWNEGLAVYFQYTVLDRFGDINRETVEYYTYRGLPEYNWDDYAANDYHDTSPDDFPIQSSEGYHITAEMLIRLENTYGSGMLDSFFTLVDNNLETLDTIGNDGHYVSGGKNRNDKIDRMLVHLFGLASGADLVPTFRYDGSSGPGWGVRDWAALDFLPDLSVTSLTFSDPTPQTLDTVTAYINVFNSAAFDLATNTALYSGGSFLDSVSLFVPASSTAQAQIKFLETMTGNHTITGKADWLEVKAESNETNNSRDEILNFGGSDDLPPALGSNIPDLTWPKNSDTSVNLLSYFSDPEDSALSFTSTSPANISVSITSTTGVAVLSPAAGWSGSDTIVFTARDPWQETAGNTVALTVLNASPVFSSTADSMTQEAYEDHAYLDTAYASDADAGDVMAYSLIPPSPSGLTIGSSSGIISWTPGNSDVGSHTVRARVVDSTGAADTLEYALQVFNTNDAPVITTSAVLAAAEDAAYAYDAEADDDDAGDNLVFSLLTAPAGMTVDGGSGSVSWAPDNGDVGDTLVSLVVTDDSAAADTQTYALHVYNVNDTPVIISQADTIAKQDSAYDYDAVVQDVDAGDSPACTLLAAPDGMSIDPATCRVTWLPDNDDVGDTLVAIGVMDDSGATDVQAYVLHVLNVNDPPEFITTADSMTGLVVQDQEFRDTVLARDIDYDLLEYHLIAGPPGMGIYIYTGIIVWTPTSVDVGLHTIKAEVTDGELTDTLEFPLYVDDVNDAPYFTSFPASMTNWALQDSQYLDTASAADPDLNTVLAFRFLVAPDSMTIGAGNGIISWTPANADTGLRTVSIEVSDGALTDTLNYTVTALNVNDPPVFVSTADSMTNGALQDVPYLDTVRAVDPDEYTVLVYGLISAPERMAIGQLSGIISWTPGNADTGLHAVSVEASDGELRDTLDFSVAVGNVNDAPGFTTTGNDVDSLALEDSLWNDTVAAGDMDGDPVVFGFIESPDSMTIDIVSGALAWRPGNSDVGTHSIRVFSSDGELSDTLAFSLRVVNTNDAPVIDSLRPQADTAVSETDSVLYKVYASDMDAGDSLIHTWYLNGDSVGAGSGSASSYWRKTDHSSAGTDTIEVRVSDGLAEISGRRILAIDNVSVPPVILTPVDGSQVWGDSLLSWQRSADPDLGDTVFYRLQISRDNGFSLITASEDSLSSTSIRVDDLSQADSLPLDEPAYWRLMAFDKEGYETDYTGGGNYFIYMGQTVSALRGAPLKAFVSQNRPNPFASRTIFHFGVPGGRDSDGQKVSLKLYDVSGKLLATLVHGRLQPGYYDEAWDGGSLKAGIYIYRIRIGERFYKTLRMVKVR